MELQNSVNSLFSFEKCFSKENIHSHIMLFFPWFLHPLLWLYNAKIKHSCLPYNEKHKAFKLACLFITHSTIHSFLMGLEISWLKCRNNSIEQHTLYICNCFFVIPMHAFVIFVMQWLQKLSLSSLLLFPFFFLFNLLHWFVLVIHCYQKDSICDIRWQANNTDVFQNEI